MCNCKNEKCKCNEQINEEINENVKQKYCDCGCDDESLTCSCEFCDN